MKYNNFVKVLLKFLKTTTGLLKHKEKIFFPNLDGLRFIAFFAVYFHHTLIVKCFTVESNSPTYIFINHQKENGALGVNLFFVLSGFLITYLLLSEKNYYKKIHIPNFYLRRVLRIWPLYFAMVILGFLIFPLIKAAFGDIPNETHSAAYYALFISNFEMLKKGFADSSILNVLWSVGVEEQFYLVWPIVLFVTPRKYTVTLFCILIIGTLFFRFLTNGEYNYYHTFAVFSDMIIGGLAAYFAFYSTKFLSVINKLSKVTIISIYLIMLFLILFRYLIFASSMAVVFERLVLSLFFAFVILEQNYAANSFYKMSNWKILSRWGVYTYGLYCLHTVGLLGSHIVSEKILKLQNNWAIMIIDFTFGLALTLAMAYISYHYFEKPFLKLKERFSYFIK